MRPSMLVGRFATPASRLMLIGLLVLLLMIPGLLIRDVVAERESRRNDAVAEIVAKWGGRQDLQGPILRVPFFRRSTTRDEHGKQVERRERDVAYFLPASLDIDGEVKTERRHRGVFEVPVYVAKLKLRGHFDRPSFARWGVQPEDVDWAHAELFAGLGDSRSLQAYAGLSWNAQSLVLEPSTGQAGTWPTPGIHAALMPSLTASQARPFEADGADFELSLVVNGAESLYFAPTAERTRVSLQSDWPHPSFQGAWLPSKRADDDHGFTAQWSVSYLGRDYAQQWTESNAMAEIVRKTVFGVSLVTPVDLYSLFDRVTKYLLLILVMTFAVIWLTEVLSGKPVHPVQYGFVGVALCLFGLLQLSFAEHFGFTAAYAVAAAAVIGLVSLYGYSILGSLRRALVLGGMLSGLYVWLYLILRAEDYALLGGSVGLFAAITASMWLTRGIDWFASGTRTAQELS